MGSYCPLHFLPLVFFTSFLRCSAFLLAILLYHPRRVNRRRRRINPLKTISQSVVRVEVAGLPQEPAKERPNPSQLQGTRKLPDFMPFRAAAATPSMLILGEVEVIMSVISGILSNPARIVNYALIIYAMHVAGVTFRIFH